MRKNLSTTITKKFFLLLGDTILLYAALAITLAVRYGSGFSETMQSHLLPFTPVIVAWLVVFYIYDLYEIGVSKGRVDLLNRLLVSLAIGSGLAVVYFYLASGRLFTIRPQRVLLIYLAAASILLYFWRQGFSLIVRSKKIANGVLIVGYNSLTKEIVTELQSRSELGYQVRGIILTDPASPLPAELAELTAPEKITELLVACRRTGATTIITTQHPRQNPDLLKSLFECLTLNIDFFEIETFYEKITGKVPVTAIEQIWFLENLTEKNKRVYDSVKRIFDVVFSILLLTVTLPFFPLIALAVKLTSSGPALFHQQRSGHGGKPFTTVKFRSMIHNAENNGPQWAAKNDHRITSIGGFLRKTRIDELPQLFNVLKNEMSLIGPRPERPEFVEQLETQIPFYKERLLVKPGLTGWAQVVGPAYGGSKEESLEKIQYDLYYIKNRSLGLDLSILLKTIRIVLSRRGQ